MSRTGAGKRKEIRVPFKESVVINGALRVKAIDISEGGIYVHTGRSFVPNTKVDVSFPLNYEVLNLLARVRFNQESVGMGLEFIKPSHEVRQKIRAYVEKIASGCSAEEVDTKRKIVAVYDDKSELRLHRSALVCEGFSFIEIKMGPGVYRTIEEQLPIDLIILALEMNSQVHFDMLNMLKEVDDLSNIPIVVISGNCKPDIAYRVISAGATEFMSRHTASPKKIAEIVNRIQNN